MPRYFFDLLDEIVAIDDEGADLPDLQSALARAREEVRVLAGESIIIHGRLVLGDHVRVRDAEGETVATVRFGDVIRIQDTR
ncbi:hypothetical protein TPR58_10195 [Sphingomonas sp. HF-S3]|uniref:DUF6894 domain-containing protein n=1 Tax=Sphingomonas rustica TaxID=3103142 RepID=A0ABV0B962_9SPHN